jgi:anti-anti-sigma factor
MELVVKREVQGRKIILSLKGILDISTTNMITAQFEKIDDIDDIDLLIFDLQELDFIDSTGIGSIIEAIYFAREKHFMIKLQGVNELTDQVFETVGLYELLKAFQEEAV